LRDHGFIIDRVDYPYFETPYFTPDNLNRLFDRTHVSPPFYGNFMTFYCRKSAGEVSHQMLRQLISDVERLAPALEHGAELLADLHDGSNVYAYADPAARSIVEDFVADCPIRDAKLIQSVAEIERTAPAVLLLVAFGADREEICNLIQSARHRSICTIALTSGTARETQEAADVDIHFPRNSRPALRAALALLLAFLSECIARRSAGKRLARQPDLLNRASGQYDAS
jgi:hypothetical protein